MAHIGNASNKALAITNAHVGSANGKAMPLIKGWMGNANSKAVPIWSKETGWMWQKYNVITTSETKYALVAGASTTVRQSSAFYAGTTYTLNESNGKISVAQTTQIARSSTGAKNAKDKYYISLANSSGTYTGTTVYHITAATYSGVRLNLTVTPYTSQQQTITIQEKGDLLGTVTAADITAYPMNGIAGGYWYVLQNEIAQLDISYSGTYTDEAVQMQNGAYRLLTLTGSGSLSIPQAVKADIWLCGGGLDGKDSGGYGGSGACAAVASEQTIQSLTVGIGAAAADSTISGDVSLTATKATASSSTGSGTGGGSGGRGTVSSVIKGDGLSKLPFGDNYFPAPYCDGGGGGGYYNDNSNSSVQGGAGGTNGSDGGSTITGTKLGGAGGGLYGGAGGPAGENAGKAATGYGSGGGGGGYGVYSDGSYYGAGGSGYQGVCFIRISLNQ